jgi:hypothetical protein
MKVYVVTAESFNADNTSVVTVFSVYSNVENAKRTGCWSTLFDYEEMEVI